MKVINFPDGFSTDTTTIVEDQINVTEVIADEIELTTGGTNKLVYVDSNNKLVTDTVFGPDQLRVFRNHNLFINADFFWNQRGVSSATANGQFIVDRWRLNVNGDHSSTLTREAFSVAEVTPETRFYLRNVVGVGATTGVSQLGQRIEDVSRTAGRQLTISFYVKCSKSNNLAVECLRHFDSAGGGTANEAGIGVYKFPITTSWQKITHTFTVPSISGKTIGSNGLNATYLQVRIYCSSDLANGANNDNLGIQDGTFEFHSPKLEFGDVATEFCLSDGGLDRSQELIACQRYFRRNFSKFSGVASAGNFFSYLIENNPPFRVVPSVSFATTGSVNVNSQNVFPFSGGITLSHDFTVTSTGSYNSQTTYSADAEFP